MRQGTSISPVSVTATWTSCGTVSFAAGETAKTITVSVSGDTTAEPDEGFSVTLSNASGGDGHVFDRQTGKIVSRFNFRYACTRFTCAGPFVLGANMDMINLADGNRLVATGPSVDSRECLGAVVSNGRMFYTSQASGLQLSQLYGEEAERARWPWDGGPEPKTAPRGRD